MTNPLKLFVSSKTHRRALDRYAGIETSLREKIDGLHGAMVEKDKHIKQLENLVQTAKNNIVAMKHQLADAQQSHQKIVAELRQRDKTIMEQSVQISALNKELKEAQAKAAKPKPKKAATKKTNKTKKTSKKKGK